MTIVELIKEEISNINKDFDEGVADKYAEREFNIPDTVSNKQKNYVAPINKGKLAGRIKMNDVEDNSDVYVNPPTLNGFERDVRAISDLNGDLYVADIDGHFYHEDLADAVPVLYPIKDVYDGDINKTRIMLWVRLAETNTFQPSSSVDDYLEWKTNKNIVKTLINNVRRKNPQFEFDY